MRFLLLFILTSSSARAQIGSCSIGRVSTRYAQEISIIQGSYNDVITTIKNDQRRLKADEVPLDSCRSYFLHHFEFSVFPHWIGTTWDYNGYTNEPGEGKLIACGYFVSTTLKHMGFNWNRFELAKLYSKAIVETITADITHYNNRDSLINDLLAKPDNLYIVGLDSHVGTLLKRGEAVWFIHSNYYGLKGPDKEIAAISQAFNDSGSWYVGTFLSDENIEKWLNGTLIPVIRD